MKRALVIAVLLSHLAFMGIKSVPRKQSLSETKPAVNPLQYIEEAKVLLQEGDIIVRLHTDPSSQFIKNFNRKDKKYSHAGIILFENGHPYVYHIVNGLENPGEKLRRDSLLQFCDPRKNQSFGIFRYELTSTEIGNLKLIIHKWYSKGIRFDNHFDLSTDQKMYCSEMVSKALSKATSGRIHIPATKLTKFESGVFAAYSKLSLHYVKKIEVIAIDNLYQQPGCTTVKEYRY